MMPTLNPLSPPRQFTRARSSLSRRIFLASALLAAPFLASSCGKKVATEKSASAPHVKWTVKTDGSSVSHPAIAPDGTIYIGTSTGAQAFSPDGKELWKSPLAGPGTPVIADDGTLYFASSYGFVFGVSSAGKLIWQPKLGLIGFKTPPALGPGASLFYLNTASDIYAFHPRQSEKPDWSLQTFREGILETPNVLPGTARVGSTTQRGAPLLLGESTLVVPRQNFLHSISARGDRSWDLELTPGSLNMAAVGPDASIYVADDRSILYAIDASGATKWRFDAGGLIVSPVVDTAGIIYFSDGSALYAVNPDGSLKWRYSKQQQPHFVTPPTLAADGTIYIGAEFGLLAFSPDGNLKWNLRLYSPTSPLTIGQDGTIYFGCGYSWLCAVQGDGAPLMHSSWPKPFHDLANTSRYSPLNE